MYNQHTPESEDDDVQLDDGITDSMDDVPRSTSTELRLARVADYEASLLSNEDPLQACIGTMNAGLMEIGVQLQAQISAALAEKSASAAADQRIQWALESLLRITRQNDRFAQLATRVEESRQRAAQATQKSMPTGVGQWVDNNGRRIR